MESSCYTYTHAEEQWTVVKRIVQTFSHPHVAPNLYFLSSVKHNVSVFFRHAMKVNGVQKLFFNCPFKLCLSV